MPEKKISGVDPGLLLGSALFLLLFVIYYPPIYAIRDESVYLKMAVSLSSDLPQFFQGRLPFSDVLEPLRIRFIYPPGVPLLLIPLLKLGWHSVFVLGVLFHFAGLFFFQKLAREFGETSGLSGLLYLFFPAFVLYSRTLMSDVPAAAICVAAYSFYFSKNPREGIAGALFGLSLFVRPTHALLAVSFGVALAGRAVLQKKWAGALRFFAGFAPFLCLFLALNFLLWGNPFQTGYGRAVSGVENFSALNLSGNLMHYLLSLLTAYPLMLAVFLFFKPLRRPEILLSLASVLIFFSLYYFQDRFPSPLAALVFGSRFLFPVIPFLILGYGYFLGVLRNCLPRPLGLFFTLALTCVLAAGSLVIHHRHHQFLKQQESLKDLLYDSTEPGSVLLLARSTSELVQEFWGDREATVYDDEKMAREAFHNARGREVYWVHRPVKAQEEEIIGRLFNLQPVVPPGELLIDRIVSEK